METVQWAAALRAMAPSKEPWELAAAGHFYEFHSPAPLSRIVLLRIFLWNRYYHCLCFTEEENGTQSNEVTYPKSVMEGQQDGSVDTACRLMTRFDPQDPCGRQSTPTGCPLTYPCTDMDTYTQ